MDRLQKYIQILFVITLVAGCAPATVLHTPEDFCLLPQNPDMSRIVVQRRTGLNAKRVLFQIADNGQPIGGLADGDDLCWDRFPGLAIISTRGHEGIEQDTAFQLDAKLGEVHYVRLDLDWGNPTFKILTKPPQ